MGAAIPYLKWRNGMTTTTPADSRIGNDLLILKHAEPADFLPGPFRLDMTITIFLEKGRFCFMADMVRHEAVAPCMIVILSGQIFQLVDISDDMDSCTIIMSELFTDGLFQGSGVLGELQKSVITCPVMDLRNNVAVFEAYLNMLESLVSSPFGAYKLEAARHLTLSMFYGYSYSLHHVSTLKGQTRQEKLFFRFEKELRAHYQQEREVAFYASRLCISPKYLSVIVKCQTSKTALAWIENYVVTECKALLLSTDMTVQQIADKLNFPSQSVFGKYFKRITGVSPTGFRNRAGRLP